MLTFIGRRLLWGVAAMLLVACVAFVLTFLAPADPARSIVGPNASAEAVERARVALGLDRPVLDQLLGYLAGVARGDLGVSWQAGGRPVLDLLLARLPATIELAVAGVAIGLALGIPLGVSGARHRGSMRDRGGLLATVTLIAIPSFLLARHPARRLRLPPGRGLADPGLPAGEPRLVPTGPRVVGTAGVDHRSRGAAGLCATDPDAAHR